LIGRGGAQHRALATMEHVFGYPVVNDVSARDVRCGHRRGTCGKSFETLMRWASGSRARRGRRPTPPRVRCWIAQRLGGQTPSCARTDRRGDMTSPPDPDRTCSAGIKLFPGDVIANGNAVRRRHGFVAPKWRAAGDSFRLAIDRHRRDREPVRSDSRRGATRHGMQPHRQDSRSKRRRPAHRWSACTAWPGAATPGRQLMAAHRGRSVIPSTSRRGALACGQRAAADRAHGEAVVRCARGHLARAISRPLARHHGLPASRGRASKRCAQPGAVRADTAPHDAAASRSAAG